MGQRGQIKVYATNKKINLLRTDMNWYYKETYDHNLKSNEHDPTTDLNPCWESKDLSRNIFLVNRLIANYESINGPIKFLSKKITHSHPLRKDESWNYKFYSDSNTIIEEDKDSRRSIYLLLNRDELDKYIAKSNSEEDILELSRFQHELTGKEKTLSDVLKELKKNHKEKYFMIYGHWS